MAKALEQNLERGRRAPRRRTVAKRNVKIAQSRPPADGRSLRAVRRDRPRRDPDQPVVRLRPIIGPVPERPADSNGQRRDRPARQRPDLQRRRDAVARARAGLPAPRRRARSSKARMRSAERETRDAYLGVHRREGARAGAEAGGEVEPDRARGDRGGLRGRHTHDGRRARCAPPAVRGAARLRAQPLRLPDQHRAPQVGGRRARARRPRLDQRLPDAADDAAELPKPTR